MIAFYRALLHLYPASFRAEYGDELCATFAETLRESSRPRALVAAVADVIPNALAAHLDILRQDLRYGLRALRRAPGFALTAIVVVALGVGANTAAFSLADFILLRPLPFPDSDRLVKIWNNDDGVSQVEVSPPNYRDWKAMATRSFSGMSAYANGAANLVGLGPPRRVQMALVMPDLLPLIGTPPIMGSLITPRNSEAAPAVLSHELWRTQFDADPAVAGRVIRLDGAPHTIIGVMPPGFRFPNRGVELWIPLNLSQQDAEDRTNSYLDVVGRLKPGATLDQARAELAAIALRLERQYPDTNRKQRIFLHRLRDQIGQRSRALVVALGGASLCILLLACANLATLLLARGASRARELSIRTALGAGRERLVRQLVTETILLSLIGGAAGVYLAWAGLPLLVHLVPHSLPIQEVPAIDLRVLGFAAVLIGLTGAGFGVLPALRAQAAGGGRQRLRSALVTLEVTATVVLLISSGLLLRAIWRIERLETGFRTDGVMTLRTALPLPKYAAVRSREVFYRRVLGEVRAIPGVTGAAYVTGLPMVRTGGIWSVEIAGIESDDDSASLRYVSPGYFATMGIPLRLGRDVAEADRQDRRPYVAVVSESLARRHWPDQDPIGRPFKFALEERTIVGVVGDVRVRGRERTSEPQVYLPFGQVADNSIVGYIPHDLVIHSTLPPGQWLPEVRRIIAAADPEQPVSNVRPLSEIVADDTAPRRVQLRVLMILSAIALLIAGVGIHGLLSFAVSQRTKELGIRRALGAQAGRIVAMIVSEGFRLAALGTVIGIALAVLVGRGMSVLLFGVPPTDVQTIAIAAALCLLTALMGCVRPALRAARVDPMTALREN